MACSTAPGRLTKIGAPAAAPTMLPSRNGSMVAHRIWPRNRTTRDEPTPSCTTVCTGMRIAGGSTMAISASRIGPPPAPVIMPNSAVQNDASARLKKISASMPGTPRN